MDGESSGAQQAQGQVEQGENQQQGGQEPGVNTKEVQKQVKQEPQKDAMTHAEALSGEDTLELTSTYAPGKGDRIVRCNPSKGRTYHSVSFSRTTGILPNGKIFGRIIPH